MSNVADSTRAWYAEAMLIGSKASALGLCVALSACGTPEDSPPAVDTSLGLDERPANPNCLGAGEFPTKLSQHPCFDGDPPAVTASLIPYAVNAPLCSDGADKLRYLAVPDGSALVVRRDGHFELPPHGVLVKESLAGSTRLETRLVTRDGDGDWHAATYVWNTSQTD